MTSIGVSRGQWWRLIALQNRRNLVYTPSEADPSQFPPVAVNYPVRLMSDELPDCSTPHQSRQVYRRGMGHATATAISVATPGVYAHAPSHFRWRRSQNFGLHVSEEGGDRASGDQRGPNQGPSGDSRDQCETVGLLLVPNFCGRAIAGIRPLTRSRSRSGRKACRASTCTAPRCCRSWCCSRACWQCD